MAFSAFTFKSASFTLKSSTGLLRLPFTMKTKDTVARESLDGLLGLLNMKSGRTASTHGGRGRTTAHGRERHELLNMHFFTKTKTEHVGKRLELLNMYFENLESRRGLRGSGMGLLARGFFTFKSKTSNDREAFAWA